MNFPRYCVRHTVLLSVTGGLESPGPTIGFPTTRREYFAEFGPLTPDGRFAAIQPPKLVGCQYWGIDPFSFRMIRIQALEDRFVASQGQPANQTTAGSTSGELYPSIFEFWRDGEYLVQLKRFTSDVNKNFELYGNSFISTFFTGSPEAVQYVRTRIKKTGPVVGLQVYNETPQPNQPDDNSSTKRSKYEFRKAVIQPDKPYPAEIDQQRQTMERVMDYRFPGERKRDGTIFEFRKTMFLYNGFQIKAPVDNLIVVEGFTGVWWLDQNGLPSVVATMGADCSEKQAELIMSLVKPGGHVWIAPDGDKAGERHAQTLLTLISPHRFMRWVKMAESKQPTDLSREELKTRFTF